MGQFEDLLGDGRLLKRILCEGDGALPKRGKRVEVHYETLIETSGAQVDCSDPEEPFDFILGEGDVLEAWDLGVASMRAGERSEFISSADLAYGEEGGGDDIPPNTRLRFVIELCGGKKKGILSEVVESQSMQSNQPEQPIESISKASTDKVKEFEAQRLERAAQAKERGNCFFKDSEYSKSRVAYEEALQVLSGWQGSNLDQLRQRNQLRISCLLNVTQCNLKLENFLEAIRNASDVIDIDPESCKAIYRRGIAYMANGDLDKAKSDLLAASKLDPHNVEIRVRLKDCKEKILNCNQWHKDTYGGMFGKAPEQAVIEYDANQLKHVWMDIQIGTSDAHRVCFALYSSVVPKTVDNFRALCRGDRGIGKCGQPLHYAKTLFHKVVRGNFIEGGDIQNYDGSGGESIYGHTFDDENFLNSHHKRGMLSMVSTGPHTNNSKFFITLRSLPQFDGTNVVFGEVVSGMYVLDAIERIETEYGDRPKLQVAILACGECS